MPRETAFFGLCFLALVLAAEFKTNRRAAPAGPVPVQAVAPAGTPIVTPAALPSANAADPPRPEPHHTGG